MYNVQFEIEEENEKQKTCYVGVLCYPYYLGIWYSTSINYSDIHPTVSRRTHNKLKIVTCNVESQNKQDFSHT